MTKEELLALAGAFPDTSTDCPFEEYEAVVLRHKSNGKWYGLVMELQGDVCINLKCEPLKADFWRSAYEGVLPGWHMNKRHWNSVFPNRGVPLRDLREMLRDSYDLTAPKVRARARTKKTEE